jgi:hypothetical protein
LSIDRDQREKVKPGELEQLPERKTKINHPVATLPFRSLPNAHMLNIAMRKSPFATKTSRMSQSSNKEGAAAAELALKAHILRSNPEILAEMPEGNKTIREIADMVDLTEAPEDAVSSLVTDLLQYCEREKIDWTQEVMSRAWERFRSERACEVQKRTFLKPSETERTSHRRARLD